MCVKTLSLFKKKGAEVSERKSFSINQMMLTELKSFLCQHRHLLVNLVHTGLCIVLSFWSINLRSRKFFFLLVIKAAVGNIYKNAFCKHLFKAYVLTLVYETGNL